MVAETFVGEQTYQLLWMHAAFQVSTILAWNDAYVVEPVGHGYGVRCGERPGVVVHPSSNARTVGNLALTVTGGNTYAVPRCELSYVAYLEKVADAVEAALVSQE